MPQETTSTENLFWFFAVAGTLFFLIKAALITLGGVDSDIDGGFDADAAPDALHDADSAFKLLSTTSISGFFMMFGWVGLACYKQLDLGATLSVLIAFTAGLLCMAILAYLYKSVHKLVSSGAHFKLENIVGKHATVYHQISADGIGKIQITVNGVTREVNAISQGQNEIESFKKVEIIKAIDSETVMVKRI